MADRKITDLTALTTPSSADVLPIVDVSEAAAADKNKKITVGELFKGVPDGTAAAPAIAFESDDGNGIFLSTTDTVGIATNGSSRMTVSTTAVTSTLPVIVPDGTAAAPSVAFTGSGTDTGFYSDAANTLAASTGGTNALYIDSSQRVGIGNTSPAALLHLEGSSPVIQLEDTDAGGAYCQINGNGTGGRILLSADAGDTGSSSTIEFAVDGDERARIDSSGRLLVGTSSAFTTGGNSQYALIQIEGNSASGSGQGILTIARGAAPASITSGQTLGMVSFTANNGGEYAEIRAEADGTSASGDYPGRLTFSTTADGASSPTERMRISSDGVTQIKKGTDNGHILTVTGGTSSRGLTIDTAAVTVGATTANDSEVIFDAQTDISGTVFGGFSFRTAGGERLRIQRLGGISFNGDTAAANALDDYEEGTWLPTISNIDDNAGGSPTYALRCGRYTKIGNIVYVDFYIAYTTAYGTGAALLLSNLPYDVSNANYGSPATTATRGLGHTSYQDIISGKILHFYGSAGNNDATIYADGGNVQSIPNGTSIGGKYIIGAYQYHTDG